MMKILRTGSQGSNYSGSYKKKYCCLKINFPVYCRGGSRTVATSKTERFVIIANGWKPLTIITKRSILDVSAALDPPLDSVVLTQRDYKWFHICPLFFPSLPRHTRYFVICSDMILVFSSYFIFGVIFDSILTLYFCSHCMESICNINAEMWAIKVTKKLDTGNTNTNSVS